MTELREEIKELEIVYRDECLVAVNKPNGLLVHRTRISDEKNLFALQLLRDQVGQHVYPVHRLDRKTSGVLIFALNKNIHRQMHLKFSSGKVKKKYLAIVRGYTEDKGIIDYPVKKDNGKLAEAITRYKTLDKVEIDIPSGPHQTSRYSLVEVFPETGRMHQIRKHFAHINHPILGDRPHGCHVQNRIFKHKWNITTMMLHAHELQFLHPVSKEEIRIKAILHNEFRETIRILGFHTQHNNKDSYTL
jgi:tRNA pseudouridine65 synthase